jgi:hypothetical protein
VHDLPGEELGDSQREDVGCCRDVGDDAPHLRAGQPFGDGAETEDNLVAVDGVDVEVDRHPVTAGRLLCERRGWEPDVDAVSSALVALKRAIAERGGRRRARPYLSSQLRRLARRSAA